MHVSEMFAFEFRYQLRHPSTWLLFVFFFLFGFGILRMVTLVDETYMNAPGTIAFFTVFGTAIWVVIGGVIAGDAATRDLLTRMHPLVYTTPISKFSYLSARFLAALSLNVLMTIVLYAGFLLSLYGPGSHDMTLRPFRLASYLTNFGFIALPAIFVTTAIQFAFATLSGRAIAAYVASVAIIIFSQFAGTTVKFLLEWKLLGSLMDLLGTSIIADMEGWTPLDKNTRLITLEGTWLWNRIAWLAVAVAFLAFTYLRFQLAHFTPSTKSLKLPVLNYQLATFRRSKQQPKPLLDLNGVRRTFGIRTHLSQLKAIAWNSFKMIALSRTGLTLVAVLAVGTGLFATEYMEWLGVPLLPRTEEILRILAPPLSSYSTPWIIIPFLIIFFTGELVWREREGGLNELSDTAPVPEWVMFSGKLAGLTFAILIWMAFVLAAGMLNQVTLDYHHFELPVYFKVLFGIQLTNYFLFAVLMLAIHALVNQKYIGHMLALLIYGLMVFAPVIGIEHTMLIYASDPGWSYSDMRGFGPSISPWAWLKLYWATWAFALSILAILFWVRSKEISVASRLLLARRRISNYRHAWMSAIVMLMVSAGFVFYNTNVLNRYADRNDRKELRAKYERQYGRYERTTQPVLARVMLQAELYPHRHEADLRVSFDLRNESQSPIDSIILSIPHREIQNVSFDRKGSMVVMDNELGCRMYVFDEPLLPGELAQTHFQINIREHGFSNDGVDLSVAENGSHITADDWMPVIGYDANRELRDARDREKFGLLPRAERPSLYDIPARYDARHAQPLMFEAIVATTADQTAIAPGSLSRSWRIGDRRYFHYVTNAPILNDFAIFSAKYVVRRSLWKPAPPLLGNTNLGLDRRDTNDGSVAIEIFYHPSHELNIERMMKSAEASLQYYTREFGPYRYGNFRVIERPGPGRGMHADPMTIDYEEGYSLLNPQANGLDLPYHIMAHEVAHQWWGLSLAPATVEGAGVLVESMATYSAMQVVEETLGYDHLRKYLTQMRQEYEVPRSRAAPPLLRANNAFMNYRKGPFAMFALRNYIGKNNVNDALRNMLAQYSPEPPLPTTLDLYKELEAVTPDSLEYLVHDLFAANTFWELETNQITAKRIQPDSWEVTIQVNARKVTVDSVGIETEIALNDWLEVGVYGKRDEQENSLKPLYLEKHRVTSGNNTFVVSVSQLPDYGGIDPNRLMIDLDPDDNTRKVRHK